MDSQNLHDASLLSIPGVKMVSEKGLSSGDRRKSSHPVSILQDLIPFDLNAVAKKDPGGFRGNLQLGQEPADRGSFFHCHDAGVFAVLPGKVFSKGGVEDKFDFHVIRSIRLWGMKKFQPRQQEGMNLFACRERTRSSAGLIALPSGIP
jgi:hypothetical protein